MKLVIGGSFQGKLDYVKENICENPSVFECTESDSIDLSKDVIYHIEKWSLWCVKNNREPADDFFEKLKNKDIIVISDDISCGVVPITKEERMWREANGRLLMKISKESQEVHRVFCGIGVRLK